MEVRCRCGQSYVPLADRFPHRVSCHVCGYKFAVLDDGSTIGPEDVAFADIPESAIQTEPLLTLSIAEKDRSTAISDGLLPFTPLGREEKLVADLRLIDLRWNGERATHSLIPFLPVPLLPSRMLSAAVALIYLAVWIVLTVQLFWSREQMWIWPVLAWAGTIFVPVYILVKARAFEKAEDEWLRERALAIANAGVDASTSTAVRRFRND